MSDPAGSLYKVVYSDYQIRMVRELGKKAAKRGLNNAYLRAIKFIHRRMRTDPLVWGDPQNRLRHLRLLLCHGTRAPLQVFFAVDEQRRIVYVREIKPLPGRGLDDAP
jgi:hypothetical protein